MFFPRQILIYDRKTYNISAYKKDRRYLFTMQSNKESLIFKSKFSLSAVWTFKHDGHHRYQVLKSFTTKQSALNALKIMFNCVTYQDTSSGSPVPADTHLCQPETLHTHLQRVEEDRQRWLPKVLFFELQVLFCLKVEARSRDVLKNQAQKFRL